MYAYERVVSSTLETLCKSNEFFGEKIFASNAFYVERDIYERENCQRVSKHARLYTNFGVSR